MTLNPELVKRLVEDSSLKVLVDYANQTGKAKYRAIALEYASEIDESRHTGHEIGRQALRDIFRYALSDYREGKALRIPQEDAVRPHYRTKPNELVDITTPESELVLRSIINAFGLEKQGVTIHEIPQDIEWGNSPPVPAIAAFNFSVPGAEYVKIAADVIGKDRHQA